MSSFMLLFYNNLLWEVYCPSACSFCSSAQVGELTFARAWQGRALGTVEPWPPPWVSFSRGLGPSHFRCCGHCHTSGSRSWPSQPVGPWYPSARGCSCTQDDLDNCRLHCSLCYRTAVESQLCMPICMSIGDIPKNSEEFYNDNRALNQARALRSRALCDWTDEKNWIGLMSHNWAT